MKVTQISYNPQYLIKDGRPWFPIMGEIHYSRYPKQRWKEALGKMKAGGVDVISSYVFWIHHEEIEGEYDFTGNRDLRAFVEAVRDSNLYLILRIGPWSHGECRNGGFPDWLLTKEFAVRANDERYFSYVQQFYRTVFSKVDGLLHSQGGPIIGVQIENEFGHCGGLNGEEGQAHMRRLTQMAKEAGFVVPLYTATGWGGAMTADLLPVMGGYCEAPWDPRITEIEPSGNYIFTHERNDHNIGSDYGFATGITYDLSKYPYLTAELGGGLQVTKHRRPVAHSKDIGAMSMVKMGSGVNLLGYYMYHGGSNPKGKKTTLQESTATGYPNDVPEISYDFNAPIREYGQISETFKEIKLLAMFIKDFGEEFCTMDAVIPDNNPQYPDNLSDLRTSTRQIDGHGYLFVNNYQRRYPMQEHKQVVLQVKNISYPPIDIKDRDFFFLPFRMPLVHRSDTENVLATARLRTALATPLCCLNNQFTTYVFYSNCDPCYEIEGILDQIELLTLTREEAKNAYKVTIEGTQHLILSDSLVMEDDMGITLIGRTKPRLAIYPDLSKIPKGFQRTGKKHEFTIYEREETIIDPYKSSAEEAVVVTKQNNHCYGIELLVSDQHHDCFLQIDYAGMSAKLYLGNECIADHFYTGQTWEVSLTRFRYPKHLTVQIEPLFENEQIFLETWPQMMNHQAARIESVKICYEERTRFVERE